MLREITAVRQDTTLLHRRWFSDTNMDLYIWFNNQVPTKFQLCFGKTSDERVLNWNHESGFSLDLVDDGEKRVTKYKMSPILLGDPENTALNIRQLARNFLASSENIEPALADFVYARLIEHPQLRQDRSNQDGLSSNE